MKSMKKMRSDWSSLCDDILQIILDKFSAIEDIVHFGAVCQPWQSASVNKLHSFTVSEPWLMLAEKEDSDMRGFYSLLTQKVYHLNLPEAHARKCFSSRGWLITLGLDLEIHLLNPISRKQIRLPPQPTFSDQFSIKVGPQFIRQSFIGKVILTSTPSSSPAATSKGEEEKCIVMVIVSGVNRKLAFLRLGDEVWTHVDSQIGIADISYLNGQFYGITHSATLLVVDISSPHPKTIEFAEPPSSINIFANYYLVESGGELFLLAQEVFQGKKSELRIDNPIHETQWFDVYKFNFDDRNWTEVTRLDNRAFFVGFNASFSIFPSKGQLGCEPNCIYFTDVDGYGLMKGGAGKDMGVYRLGTDTIDRLYAGPDVVSNVCAPLWICPWSDI